MATRAIILLFLAAIVTIWADTAEVQILENALDNTPSSVSGSAAIELEDDRLGEDDNMGVGFGGGFFDMSTATFQVKSGGGGTGTGSGGEEVADALLEEDESAMVGSSGKWEAFFTADKANKDKYNKDQQAAWAEYGKGQGLKPGKDFPRLESVYFRGEPGKGTRDGTQNVTALFTNGGECVLSYFVNVATANVTKSNKMCKGPLIKASSGRQPYKGGRRGGSAGFGRRLLAASLGTRDCTQWSMRASKAAENYFSNLRAAAAKEMTGRCNKGNRSGGHRTHRTQRGGNWEELGEDDNMGFGGYFFGTTASFQVKSGGGGTGTGSGGEEAADALLEEDEQFGRAATTQHRVLTRRRRHHSATTQHRVLTRRRRHHSATTQHRIVESTEKREAHERTQKGPQPTVGQVINAVKTFVKKEDHSQIEALQEQYLSRVIDKKQLRQRLRSVAGDHALRQAIASLFSKGRMKKGKKAKKKKKKGKKAKKKKKKKGKARKGKARKGKGKGKARKSKARKSENDWEEFLTQDRLEPNLKGKDKSSQQQLNRYGILAGAGPLSLQNATYNKPAPQDLEKKGHFTMVRIKGEVKVNNQYATCWMDYFITIKQRVIAKPNKVTCGSQPLLKNDDFGLVSGDRSGKCTSWLPSAAKAARDYFSRYNLEAMNKAAYRCGAGLKSRKKKTNTTVHCSGHGHCSGHR